MFQEDQLKMFDTLFLIFSLIFQAGYSRQDSGFSPHEVIFLSRNSLKIRSDYHHFMKTVTWLPINISIINVNILSSSSSSSLSSSSKVLLSGRWLPRGLRPQLRSWLRHRPAGDQLHPIPIIIILISPTWSLIITIMDMLIANTINEQDAGYPGEPLPDNGGSFPGKRHHYNHYQCVR